MLSLGLSLRLQINEICSLKAETVELLECLQSWFRRGIYAEEGHLASANDLAEDGAIEALDQSRPVYSFSSGLVRGYSLMIMNQLR